jgi:hypothetical protein
VSGMFYNSLKFQWGRTIGATKQLWPIKLEEFVGNEGSVLWLHKKDKAERIGIEEAFKEIGSSEQWKQFQDYFVQDPIYKSVLDAPSVKRLYAIYGNSSYCSEF